MFVSPHPKLWLIADDWLEKIPARLRDLRERCVARSFKRRINHHATCAIALRPAFHGHEPRAAALRENGWKKRHANFSAEAFDDRRRLCRSQIQVDEHAGKSAALHLFQQTDHRRFLWNN